jgi:protein-S-isoprenylcysteine O-methyltransferase Ste14
MMSASARIASLIVSGLAYLGLAILGWGGVAAFFAHPARIALTIVFAAICIAAFFVGGNLSPGVREDRGNRWVIPVLGIIVTVDTYLAPWSERVQFLCFDGNTVRWLGVALFAVGGALRLWPVAVLGNRFSGLVAIQPGHRLVTTGFYSVIRHPSYLGLALNTLGWGLAFRSGVGVLLAVLLMVPLIARIRSEEQLLLTEFGAEYEAYRARTARLVPGVY